MLVRVYGHRRGPTQIYSAPKPLRVENGSFYELTSVAAAALVVIGEQ